MNNKIKILSIAAIALSTVSCTAAKPLLSDSVVHSQEGDRSANENEKIVMGKLNVIDAFGIPTRSNIEVCLKASATGEVRCGLVKNQEDQYTPANSDPFYYIFQPMPAGRTEISSIRLTEGGLDVGVSQYYHSDNGLDFTVSDKKDATYFGHITATQKDVNEKLPQISFDVIDSKQDALDTYNKTKNAKAIDSVAKSLANKKGKKYVGEAEGNTPFQKFRTPIRAGY